MDKMRMESPDLTARNIDKIAALFPNCITEARDASGKPKKAVNFEILKQMLSSDVLDGDEAYEFTWVGKKAAIVEANKPIRKTLRPCPEESKDWDTTQNLYIEGDNLEVLKLLQESYLGKVKMIYIDPPYNTGKDFIYPDSFIMDNPEYNEKTGYFDEDGNVNFNRENSTSEGKYHSDWCSMMYSRLLIAQSLLADDGAIFVSIDENEFRNIGKICDEVFGSSNLVECLVYDKKAAPKGVPPVNMIVGVHEYVFVYAKSSDKFKFLGIPRSKEGFSNPDNDPRGIWRNTNIKSTTSEVKYPITDPETGYTFSDTWAFSPAEMQKMIKEKRLIFPKSPNGQVRAKEFYSEFKNANTPIKSSMGLYDAQWNTEMLEHLMGGKYFQNPKHLRLMQALIQYTCQPGDIVLDFFAGSSTTAHAVMANNSLSDNISLQYIMIQLPEPCKEDSDAFKAGYKTICEIGKERIRRAGEQIIKEKADLLNAARSGKLQQGEAFAQFETSEDALTAQEEIRKTLDVGFRVFKLDDSNMKDVYYAPDELTQEQLTIDESNIKNDRTDLDLLFGCLLDWGLPLSLPYTSEVMDGCTVHTYNDGDLIACFNENVPESVIREIAKRKPLRAVFRDSSFADSPAKINVFEIFKYYMPENAGDITKRVKVI